MTRSQPGPGMGQSKSSRRRRRRKRKNKVAGDGLTVAGGDGEAAPPTAPLVNMEGESLALAASAAPQQARRPQGGGQPQGQGQQQGQGGKRWKKKFRDRERRPGSGGGGGGRNENPGNDFRAEASSTTGTGYGGGGGYRPDNFGNQAGGFKRRARAADSRGSAGSLGRWTTAIARRESLAMHRRRRSSCRDRGVETDIDIPETRSRLTARWRGRFRYLRAHRRVSTSFIEELFFQAKIQETAKKLGVKVYRSSRTIRIAGRADGQRREQASVDRSPDLNNANAKPLTLIPEAQGQS